MAAPRPAPRSAPAETMVPLAAFSQLRPGTTPLAVNHQGPVVAATISFNLAPGRTRSATRSRRSPRRCSASTCRLDPRQLRRAPPDLQQSLGNEPILILAALVASTSCSACSTRATSSDHDPLDAALGRRRRVLALMLFHTEFSIIALIGVILLIGIVKKNAIMMIDFALEAERTQGLSPRDAIYQACLLRFRPIMMTTMAAMLGAVPLAIGFGNGASCAAARHLDRRRLIVSQVLTLYTTPVVYLQQPKIHGPALPDSARQRNGDCQAPSPVRQRRRSSFAAGCAVGPTTSGPRSPFPAAFKENPGWKPAAPSEAASAGPVVGGLQRPRPERPGSPGGFLESLDPPGRRQLRGGPPDRPRRTGRTTFPTVGRRIGPALEGRDLVPGGLTPIGRKQASSRSYDLQRRTLQASWAPDFWGSDAAHGRVGHRNRPGERRRPGAAEALDAGLARPGLHRAAGLPTTRCGSSRTRSRLQADAEDHPEQVLRWASRPEATSSRRRPSSTAPGRS
jgi:hypothetical protein